MYIDLHLASTAVLHVACIDLYHHTTWDIDLDLSSTRVRISTHAAAGTGVCLSQRVCVCRQELASYNRTCTAVHGDLFE